MKFRSKEFLWVALAALIPIGFAAFTNHIWEDFYITFRSSRHLVEGSGLVFNPGVRLHTYTSPLGVLVPAFCLWVTGNQGDLPALWLFRIISAGCLAGTTLLIFRRLASLQVSGLGQAATIILIIADPKLIDFSTNGMETALLVYFAVLLWSELERSDGKRWHYVGLAIGGLQWTRPDAFIIAGALIVPQLVFKRRDTPRRQELLLLMKAAAVAGLLYIPWIIWAWWYYGSPIPNTIIAKQALTGHVSFGQLILIPFRQLFGSGGLDALYTPTYAYFGGWPGFMAPVAHGVAVIVGFAWLFPVLPATVRRLSLTLFLGAFYLSSIVLFPWYVPPWTVLASITLGGLIDYSVRVAAGHRPLVGAVRIFAVIILIGQIALLAATTWQMRVHQRLVESNVRREIGLWLRAHAHTGDTVFLEPLGYIGYFSQLRTYDFPGLSSSEVVATIKSGKRTYPEIVRALKPTWLVLRPGELALPGFIGTPVLADYNIAGHWSAKPQLDEINFLPGRPWCEREAEYFVLHRKRVPSP